MCHFVVVLYCQQPQLQSSQRKITNTGIAAFNNRPSLPMHSAPASSDSLAKSNPSKPPKSTTSSGLDVGWAISGAPTRSAARETAAATAAVPAQSAYGTASLDDLDTTSAAHARARGAGREAMSAEIRELLAKAQGPAPSADQRLYNNSSLRDGSDAVILRLVRSIDLLSTLPVISYEHRHISIVTLMYTLPTLPLSV